MSVKLVHNVETDKISEVEFTKDELAQQALDKETAAAEAAKATANEEAKKALLERLGITAAEAALLLK